MGDDIAVTVVHVCYYYAYNSTDNTESPNDGEGNNRAAPSSNQSAAAASTER